MKQVDKNYKSEFNLLHLKIGVVIVIGSKSFTNSNSYHQ